ncbi:hypothetical protein ACHHYP_11695 [Achlya hypogyna]|uniref:Uncharacterized protein n=1 Tax=Achlya hypogyna TaxID=1202772 RepID=A0A1V9YIK5_ACHHY|nr:hypothetical protein ACHHYP_11695 [Achlya hypogyna]
MAAHDILCVELPSMPANVESPSDEPHPLPDRAAVTTLVGITVLRWLHPVSLEPVAMGRAVLHRVPEWMALGEAQQDDDPLLALALFRSCFFTNVHHHGRAATATLEAQLAVGDCLTQLHKYTDALTWLTDVMSLCDADDAKLRDCMALLGTVHLQRQDVVAARALFERVALLDELDGGPTDLMTLGSLLNVATVYRYAGNYAPAMAIVSSVITTAQSNIIRSDNAAWHGAIQNGDPNQGCEYLHNVFQWRLEHYGVDATATWASFSAWYWCSEHAGRWVTPNQGKKLAAAVAIMPPTSDDWPGKVCISCTATIVGAAFAPAAAILYTYLQCRAH